MENKEKTNPEKNNTAQLEAQLENYVGPEGITTKQLEIGLWYVEHKQLLRKILYGLLIFIGAVSWAYTVYSFASYFARGLSQDEKLTKELVETNSVGHDYILQISAQNLAVAPVDILKSADGKYDLFARLTNNNPRWWAEFDYYFTATGQPTAATAGYILPLETKNLLALAQEFSYAPSSAQLIIDNLRWHRLDQHTISDWNAYLKKHLNIDTVDIKFTPANASILSEKLNLNQLSFNAVNNSVFNYWEVGFTIILYGSGGLADVNHYTLNNFMSGEKRPVELSWPGNIGQIDRVEIVPEINIMRNDIYIPFEGGVGQEK